jgi:hypothetical protein
MWDPFRSIVERLRSTVGGTGGFRKSLGKATEQKKGDEARQGVSGRSKEERSNLCARVKMMR